MINIRFAAIGFAACLAIAIAHPAAAGQPVPPHAPPAAAPVQSSAASEAASEAASDRDAIIPARGTPRPIGMMDGFGWG